MVQLEIRDGEISRYSLLYRIVFSYSEFFFGCLIFRTRLSIVLLHFVLIHFVKPSVGDLLVVVKVVMVVKENWIWERREVERRTGRNGWRGKCHQLGTQTEPETHMLNGSHLC